MNSTAVCDCLRAGHGHVRDGHFDVAVFGFGVFLGGLDSGWCGDGELYLRLYFLTSIFMFVATAEHVCSLVCSLIFS